MSICTGMCTSILHMHEHMLSATRSPKRAVDAGLKDGACTTCQTRRMIAAKSPLGAERWLKGPSPDSVQKPAMETPVVYIAARQRLLEALAVAPVPLVATLQEALRQADLAIAKLMEPTMEDVVTSPKQDLRNEISPSVVSAKDLQGEEARKYCVPCTVAREKYHIPFPKWNGRTNFRRAHEGPCLHCPDTQVEVARVLEERRVANERKAEEKAVAVPEGYLHPAPYPGFTKEELVDYLAQQRKKGASPSDLKAWTKEAYEVVQRGRGRGMTLGYYWMHHLEADRRRTIEAVQAERKAQLIAWAKEDSTTDRIKLLKELIDDQQRKAINIALHKTKWSDEYELAKDRLIEMRAELDSLQRHV